MKNNNSVIGIDISETAIKKAKAKYPYIDFQVGAAGYFSQMPSVDLVVAIEVFSFVENWKKNFRDDCKESFLFFYRRIYTR